MARDSSARRVRCLETSTLSFELEAALRRLRPQRIRRLSRRTDDRLPWVHEAPLIGTPVLLDSTVYIDTLQGRSPASLDTLISMRLCNHSSVCVSELAYAFGRLSPEDSRTAPALKAIGQVLKEFPTHRIQTPDAETWGLAGILSGLLARLAADDTRAKQRRLNDALLYLQGTKFGWPVVTGNIEDFDLLNQLVPDGRILLYRKAANCRVRRNARRRYGKLEVTESGGRSRRRKRGTRALKL